MMDRNEHLQWCKDRALEYLDNGDITNAFTSFASDMGKHPNTDIGAALMQLGMMYLLSGNRQDMRRWIEGFN